MVYGYTESDTDVWINRLTTDNGTAYYNHMLVYFDDVLHLAKYAQEYMLKLKQIYRLKEGVGSPDRHLSANVNKVQLEDGRTFWYMTCVEYLCVSINHVDSILEGNKADLESFGYVYCPYPSSYRPELDVAYELDEGFISIFQQLIGVLRC